MKIQRTAIVWIRSSLFLLLLGLGAGALGGCNERLPLNKMVDCGEWFCADYLVCGAEPLTCDLPGQARDSGGGEADAQHLDVEGSEDAPGLNACGGRGELPHDNGAPCGVCGSGLWACGSGGAQICNGDLGASARNACGGCEELEALPGTRCGACSAQKWECVGEGLSCDTSAYCPSCGNGIVDTGESCDDGNLRNGDGCSHTCRVESGWECRGDPSVCVVPCVCDRTGACDELCPCDDDCLVGNSDIPSGEDWVRIPAGTFLMGSPEIESGRFADELQHQVKLTHPFEMMATPVTQGHWRALIGNNPSYFQEAGDDAPVEQVNWYEALAYANALSEAAGIARCYNLSSCSGTLGGGGEGALGTYVCLVEVADPGNPYNCVGYRLPTEAEWEYAARAGTPTSTYVGNLTVAGKYNAPELNDIAWYGGNSGVSYEGAWDCSDWTETAFPADTCGTHPVAGKQGNSWGLYDMLGNVWEWTWDWFDGGYRATSQTDPLGPVSGGQRVIRGSSWGTTALASRVAYRNTGNPQNRHNRDGFRLVRTLAREH